MGRFPSFASDHPSDPHHSTIPYLRARRSLSLSLSVPPSLFRRCFPLSHSRWRFSRFLVPLCHAQAHYLPLSRPPSSSATVFPSRSFGTFLTSNHLGPRTSAVSRSFLAAAFRHFPPDRARPVRQNAILFGHVFVLSLSLAWRGKTEHNTIARSTKRFRMLPRTIHAPW